MTRRTIILAAGLLFVRAAAAAAERAPVWDPLIPQSWCFCLHARPGWPPYYRDLSPGSAPECARMKFAPSGKDPIGELHTCEDAGQCWRGSAKEVQEIKNLEKKLSDHKDMLAACSGKPLTGVSAKTLADYENSCFRMWKAVVQNDETELLSKQAALRANLAICFLDSPARATAPSKLRSPVIDERNRAAVFLANIDASTEAIPVLIDAVNRDEDGCRAIAALGNYGPAADDAVTALADTGIKNSVCPGSATIALARIGTPDAMAALALLRKWERKRSPREERLFRALSDRDPAVRGNAAAELSLIAAPLKRDDAGSDKAKEMIAAIRPLLRDPQKSVRYRTALHMVHLDTAAAEAVSILAEAVRDTEMDEFSCAAIDALRLAGPAAKAAVPALTDPAVLKKFGKTRVAWPGSPMNALREIDKPAAEALYRAWEAATDRDWSRRERLLMRDIVDRSAARRSEATRELCSIAAGALQYKQWKMFPALYLRLKDRDKAVRYEAASCLALTDYASGAIPVLLEAIKDPSGKYPGNAALELGRRRAEAKDAVPELARLMNKAGFSYFWLQPASDHATALEQIGTPEAIAALEPLREKEMLMGALAAPFAFFVFIPPLAPLTALFFIWLFLRSRDQHKQGRKLLYQPLVVAVLGWLYITYAVTFELGNGGRGGPFIAQLCFWISVITTLAGLLPLGASWCILRLRERRQTAGAAVPQ